MTSAFWDFCGSSELEGQAHKLAISIYNKLIGDLAQKRKQLSDAEARAFYAVHAERPFYEDLVAFMTSGPLVLQVLEGENAIAKNREVMGATNPADAAEGTIRKDFAESIEANSVHGSDAPETAAVDHMKLIVGERIIE